MKKKEKYTWKKPQQFAGCNSLTARAVYANDRIITTVYNPHVGAYVKYTSK